MPTFVDLLWQVKNKLPIKFGGTGNDLGAARNMVMLHYMNDTGGALALGTLVKLHGSTFDDLRVIPTTTANELGVLGVVVGRFTTGDGLGLFEAVAPAHQDTVAVCIAGRCTVLVASAVTQGQFAYVSGTAGKAAGTSSVPLGQIGVFESDGTTSALVVLGNRAAITAPEDVYEDGVLQVDGFHILDFGAHLDVSGAGTTASVAVVTDDMTLDAEQVLVEDVGTYYTPPAPGSGTETLRPTSDDFATPAVWAFTSGSTGWNLVDEVSLDTADYYSGGSGSAIMAHGFPTSGLTVGQRIDSVNIRPNTTNTAPAGTAHVIVRDPNTGTTYQVQSIGQNSGATAGDVDLTTRPWDSQPWELTDVENLQAGVQGASSAPNLRVRQFYVEIDWTQRVTVESALAELGAAASGEILDHTTAETDDTLVLAPDGAGGVEFRAETAGSGLITKDEGSTIGTATTMDFVGAGVGASYSGGTTTVTIAGGGGGNYTANPWSSGTSFPGSPSTGDRVTRTDRGLDYYYDGTRWLTATLYHGQFFPANTTAPFSANNDVGYATPWHTTYDLWLVGWYATTFVNTTNSGTNYWNISLGKYTGATPSTIVTVNTSADSPTVFASHTTTVGALLTPSTYPVLALQIAKNNSPGTLVVTAAFTYRLVG